MRGFVAVFTREMFERRLLGVVALLLGLTAVVLPIIPGLLPGGLGVPELQGALAFGLALLLSLLLALFLGGSVLASDLAERRLGFYFARPLAGWAIWGGKIAAAFALVLGAGLLVVAPALVIGGNLNLNGIWSLEVFSVTGPSLVLAWIVALLLLLFATHAVSVVIRARSAWAVLDIAALALVAGLVWGAVKRLQAEGVGVRVASWSSWNGQLGILAWMELGLLLAVLIALGAAGALQVAGGRTDLRQSHRILSQALWGPLLATAVLFTGLSFWVLAAGPDDLLGVSRVSVSPAGPWIAFTGPAAGRPGYDPSFLYDVDSGRAVRARFGVTSLYDANEGPVYFSTDGRKAVWLEIEKPPYSLFTLYQLDLSHTDSKPERTSISFPDAPRSVALSPDGHRLAVYRWDGHLTVEEIGGRLLVATRYESRTTHPLLVFAGADRLRILEIPLIYDFGPLAQSRGPSMASDIFELALASNPPRIEPTGQLPKLPQTRELTLSPDAGRALERSRDTLQLCDARSGAVLATLADGRSRGTFLSDGRIALITRAAGGQELRLLSSDGHPEPWQINFPGARTLIVADQRAGGQRVSDLLRVVTSGPRASDPTHEVWQVDLAHGTARSLGRRRLASLDLPQIASRLHHGPTPVTGKDGVIWLDPTILRQRVVLKGS